VRHHHQRRPGVLAHPLDAGQDRAHGVQVRPRPTGADRQVERVEDHQRCGPAGQLAGDRGELAAGGQLGHAEAQPHQPAGGQLGEVDALVGGDGTEAADRGALAALAEEDQHPPGRRAGYRLKDRLKPSNGGGALE
jgi:hypothetical protein